MKNRKRRTAIGDFTPICVEVVEDVLFPPEEREITITIQLHDEYGLLAERQIPVPYVGRCSFTVDYEADLTLS